MCAFFKVDETLCVRHMADGHTVQATPFLVSEIVDKNESVTSDVGCLCITNMHAFHVAGAPLAVRPQVLVVVVAARGPPPQSPSLPLRRLYVCTQAPV